MSTLLPLILWASLAVVPPGNENAPPTSTDQLLVTTAREVNITEHLGDRLPLDLPFTDENGQPTTLGAQFKSNRPVLLSLVYFKCPMLCSLVLSGITKTMREMDLHLGTDYDALTISFDPKDEARVAREKQGHYLQAVNEPGKTQYWPFLTGSAESIRQVTKAVGFDYYFDEETKQFAHAAVVFIITPEGKISRYLYNVSFEPRQLKLALVEASMGKAGVSMDKAMLQCFKYDPASRRYQFYVFGFLRLSSLAVLLALGGLLGRLWWMEGKRKWAS